MWVYMQTSAGEEEVSEQVSSGEMEEKKKPNGCGHHEEAELETLG